MKTHYVAAALTLAAVGPSAFGQGYAFTNVADSRGGFTEFGFYPAINSSGTVAFSAFGPDGRTGIYSGNGGSITMLANMSGDFNAFANPAINADGTVAFRAGLDNGDSGVFRATAQGTLSTIATFSGGGSVLGNSQFARAPLINDAGTVAFTSPTGDLLTGDGGQTTLILNGTGPLRSFDPAPALNNGGTVAFVGERAGGVGVFLAGNGNIATVADSDGPFRQLSRPTLNDAGTIAFYGGNGGTDSGGIFTGSGDGSLSTVADVGGPFGGFISTLGPQLAINNVGRVAFYAVTDQGVAGIYAGGDPLTDKVIADGDALFGTSVSTVSLLGGGLNDGGQVAFFYGLDNGVSGLAVATPVPEPMSLGLAAVGGLTLLRRRRGRTYTRA